MSSVLPGAEQITLRILSPQEVVYEEQVLWVQALLTDGLIGIWPGHAPLLASLREGMLCVGTREGTREIAVPRGILKVRGVHCTIMIGSSMDKAKVQEPDGKA